MEGNGERKIFTMGRIIGGVITSLASLATVVGVVASDDVTSFFRTNNGNPAATYIHQELAQANGTVDETFTEENNLHITPAEADTNEEETSEILAMIVPALQSPNPTPEPIATIEPEPELELELITVEEAERIFQRSRHWNLNYRRIVHLPNFDTVMDGEPFYVFGIGAYGDFYHSFHVYVNAVTGFIEMLEACDFIPIYPDSDNIPDLGAILNFSSDRVLTARVRNGVVIHDYTRVGVITGAGVTGVLQEWGARLEGQGYTIVESRRTGNGYVISLAKGELIARAEHDNGHSILTVEFTQIQS